MEARHVRCAVTHDQVGLVPLERLEDVADGLLGCDVTLDYANTLDFLHVLQVDRHYAIVLDLVCALACLVRVVHLVCQDLAPAAGRRTQVDCALSRGENIELLIDLEQFVCTARAVSLTLGLAVVGIALGVVCALEKFLFAFNFLHF